MWNIRSYNYYPFCSNSRVLAFHTFKAWAPSEFPRASVLFQTSLLFRSQLYFSEICDTIFSQDTRNTREYFIYSLKALKVKNLKITFFFLISNKGLQYKKQQLLIEWVFNRFVVWIVAEKRTTKTVNNLKLMIRHTYCSNLWAIFPHRPHPLAMFVGTHPPFPVSLPRTTSYWEPLQNFHSFIPFRSDLSHSD